VAPHLLPDPSGCLIWQRSRMDTGYGQVQLPAAIGVKYAKSGNGIMVLVHRVAYIRAIDAPVPGEVLDHLCHNRDENCPGGKTCHHRPCANSAHLAPTQHLANILGGRSGSAINAAKTHCVRGHLLDFDTRPSRSDRARRCRECEIENSRELTALILAARKKLGMTQKHYVATYGRSREVARSILQQD